MPLKRHSPEALLGAATLLVANHGTVSTLYLEGCVIDVKMVLELDSQPMEKGIIGRWCGHHEMGR